MHQVSIQQTISVDDLSVVVASDEHRRSYVGFSAGEDEDSPFVFVQVDRLTLKELASGAVDVYTVISERCAGLTFETTAGQAAAIAVAAAA